MAVYERLEDLPRNRYDCAVIDPPWPTATWSDKGTGRGPENHYRTMSLEDIAALPIRQIMKRDSLVILWARGCQLPENLAVLEAWGLSYVTSGTWNKRSRTSRRRHMGTGFIMRSAHEPFLIGRYGQPLTHSRAIRSVLEDDWAIEAAVREHSRKPDLMAKCVDKLFPYAHKLEMFSRCPRVGWDTFGDEATKFAEAGHAA